MFLCKYHIACICIGLIFYIWEKTCPLGFWTWLTSFKMMFCNSTHLPANDKT
jgi:hypothetical protein